MIAPRVENGGEKDQVVWSRMGIAMVAWMIELRCFYARALYFLALE
jgi:hypothetical protein